MPGGFAGVDIFFVISGFVVTAANPFTHKSLFEFIKDFYSKRFTRIIPAVVVTLSLTALAAGLLIPGEAEVVAFSKITTGSIFAFANVVLQNESTNYFSPLAEYNPFTHMWSLSVEEQFYFLFPFLLFLTSVLVSKIKNIHIFGLFTLASFMYAILTPEKMEGFYFLTTRFWEMGLGVTTYYLTQSHAAQLNINKKITAIGAVPFLVIIGFGVYLSQSSKFPDFWLIITALATATLLYMEGLFLISGTGSKLLKNPFLRKVGQISFSLYLFHWPIIVILKWTMGMESLWAIIFATILSFILALISYSIIEKPLQELRKKWSSYRLLIISIGLTILISCYYFTQFIYKNTRSISQSTVVQSPNLWEANEKFDQPDCHLVESVREDSSVVVTREGPCSQNNKTQRIYVVGDSHVGSYTAMLKRLAFDAGYEIHFISKAGCPTIVFDTGYSPECTNHNTAIMKRIAEEGRSNDILFLPALRLNRLSDRLHVLNTVTAGSITPTAFDKAKVAAISDIRPVADKKIHIILEGPKPLFRASAFRCNDWFNKNSAHCKGLDVPRAELIEYRKDVMNLFEQISTIEPLATIWDPFPILCPTGILCSAFSDNKPLFYDSDHLSSHGSLQLLDSFSGFIQSLKISN